MSLIDDNVLLVWLLTHYSHSWIEWKHCVVVGTKIKINHCIDSIAVSNIVAVVSLVVLLVHHDPSPPSNKIFSTSLYSQYHRYTVRAVVENFE